MTGADDPRTILRHLEQRARRRFGQNFLTRRDVVARIVRGAGVRSGDQVLEIGPGLGILTEALREAGAEVLAVELDRDLAAYLRLRHPGLRLVEGDATRQDWGGLCPGGGWKVVSNLPFNVGTGVVVDLVERPDTFDSVTVMLQKEVVERILAEPGGRTYGALTARIQARADARFLLSVPASAFHPRPRVEAAVVRLELYPEPRTGVPPSDFDRVVAAAFSQRRKTLRNSLSPLFGRERAEAALDRVGIDRRARAETLSVARFRDLARALYPPKGDDTGRPGSPEDPAG